MSLRETASGRLSSETFWDRNAEKYARDAIADEVSYREKLRITQTYLKPDMDLLEIGCGTGSTAMEHAPHVRSILATDISGAMLDIGHRKVADADIDNIEFRQADVERLDVHSGSFDAVLALSVLHLMEDRDAALSKIHDLLSPDGLFISSTTCLADSALKYIALVAPLARKLGLFPAFDILRADDLVADMKRHGFTIEQRWQPGPRKAVFIIARKVASA